MATITTASIIARAGVLIQDATNVRWPAQELLDWLNDGQREIVLFKPEASVTNASVLLTASLTKQSIPAAGIVLLDVVRNMGVAGATPGDAIRIVSRDVLDSQLPGWHSQANADGKIKHYMFDPRDPKTYYVYPQAPATALYVELVYSSSPSVATNNGNITIDDIYANALLDYILYRCYSKDSSFAANAQLAAAHYQLFTGSIGGKSAVEALSNPNKLGNAIGNPNVPVRAA